MYSSELALARCIRPAIAVGSAWLVRLQGRSVNRSAHWPESRPGNDFRCLGALNGLFASPCSLQQQAAFPGPAPEVPQGLRMTRVPTLNSPFLLGFDEIERALERATRGGSDGYPPYNIERVARDGDRPEHLRITLAVAGFTREQLDITLEENQLVIRGRQMDDKSRQYLHRGIAARQFQRSFLLAEGMRVLGADLVNGLLCVDLVRPEPERVVQRINILVRD